jgi:hypothetical protein
MTLRLIQSLMATDQRTRLCLLSRDDGLFQYRIDRLIDEDDEFEAHWRKGYPLSGLFITLEEAVKAGETDLNSASPDSSV